MRETASEKIRDMTAKINQWRDEYYNSDTSSVTDAVYDRYFDELKRLEKSSGIIMSNSPTQTVGYKAVEGLEKTVHTVPLLSLDKTKQTADLMRFIGSQEVLLMLKLDGLTVKLEYEKGSLVRASTRGNGEEGEVVTHNASAIEGIPGQIPYRQRLVVVGEAFIKKSTFEKLKKTLRDSAGNTYKNARNMAAGSIRSYDAKSCAGRGLVFSPFGVIEGFGEDPRTAASKFLKLKALERLGFSPCVFFLQCKKSTEAEIAGSIKELRTIADDKDLPIDGIVASYSSIPYSLSCGRTGHHYKDGLAYKFEDDLYETTLRGIEWTPSRSGELSPVALFDTVEIDGCEVSRASLHNISFIWNMELMPGCRILVSKRNMIIPHVEENLDRGRFSKKNIIPAKCPCCGQPTRIVERNKTMVLRCDNQGCTMQTLRKFVHFVDKKSMDIEGLSEATLEKFTAKGWICKLTDIYRLDEHEREIVSMEGFGERSWRKLWEAIERSRDTTFEQFVVAVDIPMIGRTASRELCRWFNGSLKAFEAAVNKGFDFSQLNGFGDVLNCNIHEWFKVKENQYLWKELQTMTAIKKTGKAAASGNKSNPFAGRIIAVTGKLENFTRDSINTKIESLGAKVGSSVSKSTDYLICGEKAGSKLGKAQSLGVKILTEAQFLSMAGIAQDSATIYIAVPEIKVSRSTLF
jgi:DNA ligase (NAD+)